MDANKHLLLWSSLVTLLIVISAIAKENYFQDWRTIQREIRASLPAADADRFEIELRQIVAPKVGATDRCPSCHVGMSPGEKGIVGDRLYGAHPDVFHDPEEFGCTICHAGQGRATVTADAHGNVPHWPEPMLAKKYLYAGCGTCHAFEGIAPYGQLIAGAQIVDRLGCAGCHQFARTPQRDAKQKFDGPDLTLIGLRGVPSDWLERHSNPLPPTTVEERRLVRGYLGSRVGAPLLVEAQATFNELGCWGCHKVGSIGGYLGPPLARVGLKDPGQVRFDGVAGPHTLENFFAEHFRDPARVTPGSRMLKQDLSEQQIERLTFYMLSLRRKDLPTGLWPNDRLRIERFGGTGFIDDGPSIVAALCTGCHGAGGRGGITNLNSVRKDFPPLDQLAARYQLHDREEVSLVVAELREHGKLSAERPLDVPMWSVTLAQDAMVRTVIEAGNPSGKADPSGPFPIEMPAWGNMLNRKQLTEVITHLLSISELDDEDEDEDDE